MVRIKTILFSGVWLLPHTLNSTHWSRNKMDAIPQMAFSNAFSWMKMFKFRLRFHWNLFAINNIPALGQIMDWCRPGDKTLSGPMMVDLPTHICVTRPQWGHIPAKLSLKLEWVKHPGKHYSDVIMSAMTSQITGVTIDYPTVYSRADQRKHQSSASLAFVRGIHRWPVNPRTKGQ